MAKRPDNEGQLFSARFALEANFRGYCGQKPDQEIIRRSLKNNRISPELGNTFAKFRDLHSFLSAIASVTRHSKDSQKLAESYWLGGDLTEKTYQHGRKALVKEYTRIMPEFGQKLDENLPPNLFLTHLSQVAFIASHDGFPEHRLPIINQCMVAAGKVISFNPNRQSAIIDREVVVQDPSGKHRIVNQKHVVQIDPDLTPNLTRGQSVAIHQGFIATTLDWQQTDNLKKWNKKVVGLL